MILNKPERFFLYLLQFSVNNAPVNQEWDGLPPEDWPDVFHLAERHGLVALLMDILGKIRLKRTPPSSLLLHWLGQAAYRERICRYQFKLSCEFAECLRKEDIKCIVLKGLALASYYPDFSKREFGDLDCYLIKNKKNVANEGDLLAKRLGLNVEEAGYKHSHIRYKELLIENHHFLTNFSQTKQGIKIERILRQLALEGRESRMGETKLWKPSPEFQVIFYLMHSLGDFIAQDMPMRAVYDWAIFLQKEQDAIDWENMNRLLEECRLRHFFDLMNEICMTYLGLDIHAEELTISSHPEMAESMILDVLRKPTVGSGQLTLLQKIPNIWNRFKRQYKYRLIETESVGTLMWNTIAFSSYMHRNVKLD